MGKLLIDNVQRSDEGIIVDFSDGTSCLYTPDELRTIIPAWQLVTDADGDVDLWP